MPLGPRRLRAWPQHLPMDRQGPRGTIEARNGELNGAEFTVVLPLKNVTSPRPETARIDLSAAQVI